MTLEAIGPFENDTQQLTPGQKVEFRRRLRGVTIDRALQAMSQYRYFMVCGGKRPFLHDVQSRIVAPVTPEVIDQLQKLTGSSVLNCEPWWKRQMDRLDRHEEGGAKIYDDTIFNRMIAKRAKRQTRQLLRKVEPPRVDIELVPKVAAEEVVVNRFAETPALYKKVGGKIVAMVFFDGDNLKHTTVYHIENGVAITKKSSRAQKYTEDELNEKGWKMGKLEDDGFEPILLTLEQGNLSITN